MDGYERQNKRELSPSPSGSSSDESETSKKRKKEKKRNKKEKKRRKKEKKRQRKEEKRQRKLESERATGSSEHKRAPPTSAAACRPHTSLLNFMQPLSTGYSSDRKHATASAYKGFEGKNAYDKELEQNYQHSWGSEAGRESKLQAMVREEAAAEREKQRRR